jgi:hypothetical protein
MSRDQKYGDPFGDSDASERGGTGDKSKTKKYIIFGCESPIIGYCRNRADTVYSTNQA